jgi:hypothetical protein
VRVYIQYFIPTYHHSLIPLSLAHMSHTSPAMQRAMSTNRPSPARPWLLGWSLLWFVLCSTLVYKHPQCLVMGEAFVSCFIVAYVGSWWLRDSRQHWQHSTNTCIHYMVSVGACTLALYRIRGVLNPRCLHYDTYGRIVPHTTCTTQLLLDASGALSWTAGYLAFEHWWTALSPSPPTSPTRVLPDAVTLTGMVTALVLGTDLYRYSAWIGVWIFTKYMCIVYQGWCRWYASQSLMKTLRRKLDAPGAVPYKVNPDEKYTLLDRVPAIPPRTPLPPTLVQSSSMVLPNPPLPTQPVASKHLWIIHGVTYDLSDYVAHHPGGAEALRLGQGRDCTALFESYHPFSTRPWRILEKYRTTSLTSDCNTALSFSSIPLKPESSPQSQKPRDMFYTVLCTRAAQALQKAHVDPILDRTATWSRIGWYVTVMLGVMGCALLHVRVS